MLCRNPTRVILVLRWVQADLTRLWLCIICICLCCLLIVCISLLLLGCLFGIGCSGSLCRLRSNGSCLVYSLHYGKSCKLKMGKSYPQQWPMCFVFWYFDVIFRLIFDVISLVEPRSLCIVQRSRLCSPSNLVLNWQVHSMALSGLQYLYGQFVLLTCCNDFFQPLLYSLLSISHFYSYILLYTCILCEPFI